MKLKDKEGNEVEVADDNPVVAAALKLQNLGFSDVDELLSAKETDLEKLRKQTESDNEMIRRQANELGQLRKVAEVTPDSEKEQNEAGKPSDEPDYDTRITSIQSTLSDEELKVAEQKFSEVYNSATPEARVALNSSEGRSAFLDSIFEGKAEESSVSLFGKPKQKSLSATDQVKMLLSQNNSMVARQPMAPQMAGTGFHQPESGTMSQSSTLSEVGAGDVLHQGLYTQ